MELKIDVCECDLMGRNDLMERIAKSRNWDITLSPDYGTGEEYRIVTNDGKNREGTYSVANDEIEWDDGCIGSLFSDHTGNNDYTGESLIQFLGVSTAIWGTIGDDEMTKELVLYVE